MRILSAEIKNLFSIRDIKLSFDDAGLILLNGLNHDDRDRSNGSGKTNMLLSISYGIYGKFPKDVNIDEVIRIGEEKGYVIISLKIGEDIWTVKRERPKKETYWLNGIIKIISQEEFENAIGLSYSHYLISLYFAQGNIGRFLTLSDTDKKTFLLHLKNLDKFGLCKKECFKEMKANEEKERQVELKVESIKGQLKAYTEQLVLFDRKKILKQIEDANSIIEKNKTEIEGLSLVRAPDLIKLEDLKNKTLEKLNLICKIKGELSILKKQKSDFEKKINNVIPCPHCAKDIVIVGNTLNKLDGNLRELLEKETFDLVGHIAFLEHSVSEEPKIIEIHNKIKEGIKKEQKEYDEAKSRCLFLQAIIDRNLDEISRLTEKSKDTEKLREKIEVLINKDLEEQKEVIDDIKSEKILLSAIGDMFSSTGIPSYVLDGIIDNLNAMINKYISLIWSNASYTIRTYKENNKGEVSTKFSYLLSINGRERTLGSLSGGEARSFSLAVDFAIMDLLSSEYGSILSPVILDEPFDGLDSIGKQEVISVLKKVSIDRQIVIVDHTEEFKLLFDKVWTVERKNDISVLTVSL